MRRAPSFRPFGLVLAILAFAVQALIPAGFMPASAGGAPAVVLCTGQGPAILDPITGGLTPVDDEDQGAAPHGVCAFAAVQAIAPPAEPAAIAAPLERQTVDHFPPAVIAIGSFGVGPPLPARGPPLTA